MKRPVVLAASAALALAGLSGPAWAQSAGDSFSATLSGAGEIPPGDPDGSGSATMTVRGAQLCFSATVSGVADITAGHIHRGGEGVAGPVVVPLLAEGEGLPSGEKCADVEPALLGEITSSPSGFYANFHNAEFPGGAVRGQLVAGSLPFTGTTASELALAGTVLVAAGGSLLVVARRRRPA